MIHAVQARSGDPRDQLVAFLEAVGSTTEIPDPMPPGTGRILQANNAQRPPEEAEVPFDAIREARIPVLVVTGGHLRAFEVVADVLERELNAERAELPGRGHSVQRLGSPFNDRLRVFIDQVEHSGG